MNILSQVSPLAESAPAGGAAIDQVVIATAGAMIVTTALLVLGWGHRSGRIGILGWGADLSSRISGLPGWVALPSGLAAISLLGALFGMMWDISIHIDEGRDEGPLANPAHYFILAGLYGVFSAGFLAMVLPKGKPSATAIKLGRDWYAPLGGIMIAASASFSLIGFPLDDVWHRLFGQDVTLWGPTHLMLLGGAAMSLIGIAVLLVEGTRARVRRASRRELPWVAKLRRVALTGGVPDRALDLPGRVRLRRPAVPLHLRADDDRDERRHGAGGDPRLARPRLGAGSGRVLPRRPRRDLVPGRPRYWARRPRTSRFTSSRACWSSSRRF